MSDHLLEIFKNMELTEVALIIMITVVIVSCLIFLSMAVLRRLYNSRKYRVLDNLRSTQLSVLNNYINAKAPMNRYTQRFKARPGSKKWVAMEDNLFSLISKDTTHTLACQLFEQLGYVDYYRTTLNSRKVLARAAAISKLGRMESLPSAEPLLAMLRTDNTEIIAVTVRALCKIGDASILFRLMNELPELLKKDLVTKKTIDSSLVAAGPRVQPIILAFAKTCKDPGMIASILGVLNALPVTREVYDLAVSHLNHADPEVRTKALKVIAPCEETLGIQHEGALLPLLKDPVWFVRLQAVRTLGGRQNRENAQAIAALVIDEKWQVRNAAAIALTLLGEGAIDAFLTLLRSNDRYAKESVCEEMEKTYFVDLVLELLGSSQEADAAKAREILAIMASCGFTSPLLEFAVKTSEPTRAAEIKTILAGATAL